MMNIAVFTGGDSSESVISMKSAGEVKRWLMNLGYSCSLVVVSGSEWTVHHEGGTAPMDKSSFSFVFGGQKLSFDFAWNMIHGTPGEDGKLQGYFDIMDIPYSSSGHFSSALTFNKYTCKSFLKQHDILTAESSLVRQGMETDLETLGTLVGFPCFVKPNNGGSSFGIAKVSRQEQLQEALDKALREDREALVERYVKGTEVTCGLVRRKNEFIVFPITEIVTENEFFDYEAKYTAGKAREITPARIDESLVKQVQELAIHICKLTDSSGLIRVDFIIKGNQIYFLELNSIPGMSKESIVPQQVKIAGYTMEEVLQWIIEDALSPQRLR